MPRKYSQGEKLKWLAQYESGQTEKAIARALRCDQRTIRRGIEEVRRQQDVKVARTELVKDALIRHQEQLLKELDRIQAELILPALEEAPLSWQQGEPSIYHPGEAAKSRQEPETLLRRLLKQHLKQDKLWKALALYRKTSQAHRQARRALQLRIVALLQEKSGCLLLVTPEQAPPALCSYTLGELFYRTALQDAWQGKHQSSEIASQFKFSTASGEIRYQGLTLAVAPGKEEQLCTKLIETLPELQNLPEIKAVIDSYRELPEIIAKARQILEGILALGLVSGQCDICQRLGL